MKPLKKRHHYLPQSYQNGFTRGDFIWVFDRKTEKIQALQPINTAVIRHYYSLERDDGTKDDSVEDDLAEFDALIPSLVSILEGPQPLSEVDHENLCFISALFLTRVPEFHEEIQHMEGGMTKHFLQSTCRSVEEARRSIEEWKQEDPEAVDIDPQKLYEFYSKGDFEVKITRNRSIENMIRLAPVVASALSTLNLGILHAPPKSAFITTDRPFVFLPMRSACIPRWGGIGILTPNVHKYLPLSSTLALVFGDSGKGKTHVDLDVSKVKFVNTAVGRMADRFLLGRDEALVRALSKRLSFLTPLKQ